ncbi:MAG: DMT family transporter [Desulfobacterales bacterium]|jgi:drug/metabolite transporter (DMT)-like permease|nr:DMT family transporter [Desulfobacterales bacterium]
MQKFNDSNYLKAFFLAFFAGTIWSFGALIVRYMEAAQSYQWQYLFFRGLTIAVVILIYLMARDGFAFIYHFKRIGLSGLIGAVGLVTAMSGYILSITLTTVANTLFMLAASPFIAALLGIVLLKEKLRYSTWVAMVIALLGILVMVLEGLAAGNFLGNLLALVAALGFAVFSVSLRWRRQTPQFATIALAGVLCMLFTLLILFLHNETPAMPLRNVYLSILHGFIVCVGLILFSISAKFLPAAELTLLLMVEAVGGILWVYLPIFGIHEIPSVPTVAGGIIVLGAIVLDGVSLRQQSQISHENLSL